MPINTNLLEEALAKLTKGTADAIATQQKPIEVMPPQAQDTASKINKQASNLEQRMVNQGIDPSQFTDKRNILEKGLNLTPNQNVLFDIFEVINRPQQAIFGAIEEATSGGNVAEGFAQGLAGTAKTEDGQKHYYSGGQILRNIFMGGKEETGELDWTDIAGFGLDVFADPADLLLFKASSVAKTTKALGKQATKLDKLFDAASEGIEKFGLYKTAMSKVDETSEILDETIKAASKVNNTSGSLLDKIKDSFTLVRPEELAADVKLAPSTLTMRAIFGTGKAALGITDEVLEASTKYFGKGQDYASIKNFVQEFFNKGGSISQEAITKMRLAFGGEALAKQYMDEAISVTNDIVNNWAEKFSIEPKALDKMFAEYWSVTLGKQSANVKDLLLGVKRRTTIPYSPEFFEELSAYFKKGTNPTDFLKVVELDGDKFIVIKELKANVLIPDAATKKVDIPQLIGADKTESILKYNEKYPEFEKAFTEWKDQYVRMREGLSTIMQNDYGIGTEYLRNVLTDDAKLARNQIDEVNKKFTDMFSDSTKTIGDPRLFTSKKYMADPITASKWLKAQRMVDTLDRVDTVLRDAAELSANSRLAQTVASEVNGLFEGSNININKTIRQILDSMMLEEDGKADLLAKFRTIAEEEFGKTAVKKQLDELADKLGFTDDTVPINITEKRFTLAGKKANTLGELLDPEEYNELVALKKNNPEVLKERLRPEVFDAIGEKTVKVPKKVAPVNKQAQLDIINSTNPAQNSINTWIRKLEDIKTFDEVADASQDLAPDYTKEMVSKAKTSGKITVYSSKPIENGNFVTPSKIEAENYAGTGNKIYSKEVNVSDVAWIDGIEGQYAKASATQATVETTAQKIGLNDTQSKLAKEIGLDAGESVEKGIEAARNKYNINILANKEIVAIKQKTIKNYSVGRNADVTEMVSTNDLKAYVELDRIDAAVPLGWKKEQTIKSTEQYFTDLANDIRENGFTEPLVIEVNPKTGFAKLGEGNHRYAVAKLLGIDEVPVRVVRNNSIAPSKTRGGWFVDPDKITGFRTDVYGDKQFFNEMKPSDVGLPSTPLKIEQAAAEAAAKKVVLKDTAGIEVTEEASSRLAGTIGIDKKGRPITYYHGTAGEEFEKLNVGADEYVYLTPEKDFATKISEERIDVYGGEARVQEYYTDAKKIFDPVNNKEDYKAFSKYMNDVVKPNNIFEIFEDEIYYKDLAVTNMGEQLPIDEFLDYISYKSLKKGDPNASNWFVMESDIVKDFVKANGYDGIATIEDGIVNIALLNPDNVIPASTLRKGADAIDDTAKKALDKFAQTEYNEATKYVDPEGKYLVGGEHGRMALTANEDMLSLTKKGYILITDNGGILINKVPTVEQLKALEDPIRFAKTDKLIIEFGFETPAYKTETINIKGKTPKQVTDEIKRFIKTDKTIIDKAVNSANASQVALDIIEQRISEKAKFLISDSTLIKTLRDKLVASEKYTIDEINQLTSPEGIKQLNTYLEDIMVKNEDNVRDYVKKSAEWLNNTQAQEVFEVSVLGSMVDLMETLPRTIKSARLFDVILGPTFADIGSANSPIQWIPFEKQVVSAIKDEAGNVVKKVEKRIFPKVPPGFKKLEHPQQFVDKIREMNKFVESDELNKVADWIESSIDKSVQSADGTIVKTPGIIAIEANMIRHLELDYNKVSNSLLKIADFSNSLFKRNKLLSPGFNARNVLGIYTNLALGNIMPDEAGRKMISGLEVFKQGPGLLRRATTENLQKVLAGESTQFTAEEVKKLRLYTEYIKGGLTPPKSLKQTLKDGLTGSGSELMDLENVGKELENLEGKLPDWITKSKEFADKVSIANGWVNETVDALGRMVVLQKALDEPDYLIKLGVKNPIDAVRLVMFDNKNLSTYEQEIGKRVIPFYSFAKQNLAFHMKNLPNNTPIYNKFYKGIKSAWRAIGINDEDLEDYKMEQMYIPIPALTKDGKYYAIKANLPQSEVGEFLSNPLKKITASTTPLIRAPFELAANKSIFTGREIEEFEGQQSTQLPFLTRKQEYLVGQTGIDVPLKVATGAFDVLSMRNPVKGAIQMSNIIQEGSVQAGKTNAAYEKLNALQNGVKLLKQKDIDLQTLAQQEKQITTEKLNNVQQILSQIGK